MRWQLDLQQTVISHRTVNSTVRTIFIRTTRRTIRFHSSISQIARNGYVEIEVGDNEEKNTDP